MLGLLAQLGREDRAGRGAEDPARRRAAPPRARLGHVRPEDGRRRGGPDPRLDRRRSARSWPTPRTRATSCPSEGTLFWLDTWVMLADAPHPNAAYAWLDFIHRARDPGRGDELQPVRDAERRGEGLREAGDPRRPGDLPAGGRHRQARSRRRTRRATTSASTSGKSSSRRSAADPTPSAPRLMAHASRRDASGRSRSATGSAPACSPRSCCSRPGSGTSSCSSCR